MATQTRLFYKALSRSYLSGVRLNTACDLSTLNAHTKRTLSTKELIKDVESEESFVNDIKAPDFPVIVDFHADWCGPCKLLAPKLLEAVREDARFRLLKVNIDNFPETTKKYKIMSVPTVYAFYKGEPLKYFIGFQNTPGLKKFLEEVAELAASKK
ncbi:hypothetical protein DSO57_1024506 [Entomophthora muscae]|uniref:Uncharacterized protein n=1 Tax=Entomophthora muscae TaxID=34485 RepID=A0ACC2T2M1_9FUNG|nr:hypothetical protein DSO57_1024506 [Entomophthora muscae]